MRLVRPDSIEDELYPYQAPRPVRVIGGWDEIASAFGVPRTFPRQWYDLGAPIVLVGKRPVTETWELW